MFYAARNAIIVVMASGVAAIMIKYDHDYFTLTGNITAGLPSFEVPRFSLYDPAHNVTMGPKEVFEVSLHISCNIIPGTPSQRPGG